MALKDAYPLRLLCRVLEVPQSTLYYRPKDHSPGEAALCNRLRELMATGAGGRS